MENKGLVSIIMPLYNSEKYVSDSIKSVLNQTYPYWELIIVDDCSTDSSVEVVNSFNDDRIKLLHNGKNSGAAISRNYALREAKGKWIAFLDSDDIWVSTRLEEQLNFMIDHNYSFTYSDYRICYEGKWEKVIRTAPKKITRKKLFNYCYFSTITVMYDADIIGLIQIGDIKKNNDYAMWFEALKKTDAYHYPRCLAFYIKHNNSVSSGNKIKLIKWHYYLFKNVLGYGKIKSSFLTLNNLFHGVWKKIIYKQRIRKGQFENESV